MTAITDKFGKASIDTNYALATTVKTARTVGETVLACYDLSRFSQVTPVFFVTYKKTTNPTTNEVTVTNQTSWKAIVNPDNNTLTNLTLAPGYTDIGNDIGDFVECIPTSYWENSLIDGIFVGHNPDGSFKKSQLLTDLGGDAANPIVRYKDNMYDHVSSGVVIAGLGYGSSLNASMSAGVCYINGNRQTVAAVATRSYTPSKDTYVDLLYNASGVATPVYTEVANNAASPVLAADSIRAGIVVTGAANILNVSSINQGQESCVLPIASGIPYAVTDSLGNLICPRDPNRKVLGYRRIASNSAALASGVVTIIPGLTVPFKVDGTTRIRARFHQESIQSQSGAGSGQSTGIIESGSYIATGNYVNNGVNYTMQCPVDFVTTPTAGLHTYSAAMTPGGGTAIVRAVAYISIERY